MSIARKLISNTIYLFSQWIAITVFSFLYWFVAGKSLLPSEYGIVSTSVNFVVVLSGISLLGLGAAAWKLIPEYLAKRENKKVDSLVAFSLKAILTSNIIIAILILLFSGFLTQALKISFEVILIVAVSLILFSISSQLNSILQGFQKMKIIFLTDSVGYFIKFIISSMLIFLGFKYFGPLLAFLISFLIAPLLKIKFIPLRSEGNKINRKEIMVDFALPALVASLAWLIFLNGQYVLLTFLKDPGTTGIFSVAMILTSPIVVIPATMTSALLPITSQLSVGHDSKKKQSRLIELVFRYGLLFALPIALFLILFSKQVILLFSQATYLPASQLFPLLALGSIIYGLGNVFLNNLYAIGKTKINRNIVIVTTLAFLTLAVPLILLFSALGLAIAYNLAVTILALLSFFYIRKFLAISLPWKDLGKIIVANLISFCFLYITTSFTTGLFIGILLAIIAGLIYLIALIPMRFYIKEDVRILEFVASKLPILRKQVLSLARFLSNYT